MSHWSSRFLPPSSFTRSQAAFWLSEFFGIAQVQPPERLTRPLPSPFWVGIGVVAIVLCHAGHGAAPPFCQFSDTHEPSRSMPSLPCGSSFCGTVLLHVGASASLEDGISF